MLRYIARRVLIAIPTLVIVSMLVFALQKLLPGDPVLTMAGEERDPQVLAYLREKYRLDDPLPLQYFAWIGQVLQGNLGVSLRTDIPVLELILGKLPVTLELAIFAMIVALAIGIPTGILSAVRKGTAVDYTPMWSPCPVCPSPISGSAFCSSCWSPCAGSSCRHLASCRRPRICGSTSRP
jgi:peptide/nickel transport system permease protein